MFDRCPMCGKRTFSLFRKSTNCPKCGASLSELQSPKEKKAETLSDKGKIGRNLGERRSASDLQFPVRRSSSLEDDLKRQWQGTFEMGSVGESLILGDWDGIFKDRPFDIPYFTALKNRACILVLFSSQSVPREDDVLRVVSSNIPMGLQVESFLQASYPIVRCNFIFPDNPRDPLILETPLDILDGNFQDFCEAVAADEQIDIIMKHESSRRDVICAAYRADGLAPVVKREVSRAVAALRPTAQMADFSASMKTMNQVFPSGASGVQPSKTTKLVVCGEARNRCIRYGSDLAKQVRTEGAANKDGKKDLVPTYISLMEGHGEAAMRGQANDPAMQANIARLIRGTFLQQAANLACDATEEMGKAEQEGLCVTKERNAGEFYIIVTVSNSRHLPIVAQSFQGGYLMWVANNIVRVDRMPGSPAFVHWIFMPTESGEISTHLTITQQDKRKKKVLACDLLSPEEFRPLGIPDSRPDNVKRQWAL